MVARTKKVEYPDELKKAMVVNPLVWAEYMPLMLSDGVQFKLEGKPYLQDIVECDKRVSSIKKGTQIFATTAMFVKALHACYWRHFNSNIIYMMPTVKQVEMVAKTAFDPIFKYNGWLKRVTSNDSASVKTINGRSIVFVGAQPQKVGEQAKDSVNLRSIPADAVYRDEIDLMDPDMVDMSKQRLNASDIRLECNFGSPTIPGYGIDKLYDEGDQRKWMIPCRSCGKHTNLADEFPRSIIKKDGRWFRACVHCHNEIFVGDGAWVATYPDRRTASFCVEGLISPKADLEEYMFRFNNSEGTKLAEFRRSILGQATIEAGCQLSVQDVLNCCCNEGLQVMTSMETAMGVDVGNKLHVVFGIRTGKNTYRILNMTDVSDFNVLHDMAVRMNVKYAVIDKGPDIHAVRMFQKQEPYSVYRCQYSEQMLSAPDFNRETGVVKVNRNEICDQVHAAFTDKKIIIPRESNEVREFATQLTKMAKDIQPHPETGVKKVRWIKLDNKQDHYFHACGYFILAASKLLPAKMGTEPKPRFTTTKSNFVLR